MKFKIGDKVYLREDSRWSNGYDNNPLDCLGVVTDSNESKGLNIAVKWCNGHENTYREGDLKMVIEFTKADLKDWMVVKYRAGDFRIVNLAAGVLTGEWWNSLTNFNHDLTNKRNKALDIVEVFEVRIQLSSLCVYTKRDNLISVWKREERSEEQIELESIRKEMEDLSKRAKELEGKL